MDRIGKLGRMMALAMLASVCRPAAAQTFAHYVGYANKEYGKNGMQQVHEIDYYYYVNPNGSRIDLLLPIENFTKSGGNLEPMAYFRWYDYTTDMASPRLSAYASSTALRQMDDADNNDRGLVAYNLTANPCQNNVGVTYTPPADAKSADWQGETIACDVSKYADFGGVGGTVMNAEPTLSYRCIFHILPGERQADDVVNTTSWDIRGRSGDLTIEDNRCIVFGIKDRNSSMTLRTDNSQTRYFFHPLRDLNKHIYANDSNRLIKSSDYDKSVVYQSTNIQWRVYDPTKSMYTIMGSNGGQMWPFTDINNTVTNRNGWCTLDGKHTSAKPAINYGDRVYFVAYAKNGNNMAPIANFELLYQNTYPKSTDEITASGETERTISYLDSHYQQAMKPISFDDDNDEMDMARPTTPENNASHLPSKWNKRTYGFVYYALSPYMKARDGYKFTPIHGEYGLYKSANLGGISVRGKGYRWWPTNGPIYDRTYEISGGKQYGHFLYIDASDESRQIARADFKANLCSGSRLIFSGYVADYTTGVTKPQVMFRLYGVIKDADDNVTDRRLITSFSSGDFSKNVNSLVAGNWMQVYAKIVLPKNSGAENYSDFSIVMDNMCQSTSGADYLIDDLRLYIQRAKIDVVQNKPVCPDAGRTADTPKHITLKIRTGYDNILTMVGNKQSYVYYRICDLQGRPVSGIDYDGDGQPDSCGRAEIPAAYDAGRMLPAYAADGQDNVPMFETDAQHNRLILLANRHFNLPMGQRYYVSVAYPDDEDGGRPGVWGRSTDACSTYSEDFEVVRQNVLITDANGNVVTTVRVSCDDHRTPNVNINGKLETVDVVNGGKVTLNNVKFDWFLSKPNEENDFSVIEGLQEALARYRTAYPDMARLAAEYQRADSAGYALLKKYVDEGRLVISASNNLDNYQFGKDMMGVYKIAAIPIATTVQEGKTAYDICPDPLYFSLRIVEDGPKLTLGFSDVVYPNDSRSVRIGLPQIHAMVAKGKELILPVSSLQSSRKVKFENNSSVFIADTDDPSFSSDRQIVGRIRNEGFTTGESQLYLVFDSSVCQTFHEGYRYELNFSFRQERVGSETVVSCPGETFITFKIVPEYLTWNATAENKLNANWNNDLNWIRSTAAEIYRTDYTDYGTPTYGNAADSSVIRQQAYTPMKFSKVTIVDQTGKVYPSLGNIVYRSGDQTATKLTNTKGEDATTGIAYDIVVKWNAATADHSDTGDGTFSCEKFQGNLCDEIYFKPHTELLNQTYLRYHRAYVEKELRPNRWTLMSSPLMDTYAGDMFAPTATCRQETEAFRPVRFDPAVNSRTASPVYQRNWDHDGEEVVDGLTRYHADDYHEAFRRIDTLTDQSLHVASLYWSHVYNRMSERYADGRGFAVKAGDDYTTAADAPQALFRLPKEDTCYAYSGFDGQEYAAVSDTLDKADNYRLLVAAATDEGALGMVSQPLTAPIHQQNRYFMVGNPYTATLSIYSFLNGNPALERKVWTLVDGTVTAYDIPEGTYERKQDLLIEPMQAFFVKLKDGQSASHVQFTQLMTVDRWMWGGETKSRSLPAVTLTASNADGESRARIVMTDAAEDAESGVSGVELLADAGLSGVPQVYTVASDQAMAINRLSVVDWLPIGVVASRPQPVTLTLRLNRRYASPLYLYDVAGHTFTAVADSISLQVQANEHGRYYLTSRIEDMGGQKAETVVRCYSPSVRTLVVSAVGEPLAAVAVYDMAGRQLLGTDRPAADSLTLTVSSGLCIVKVTTADGQTTSRKVYVK